MKLISIVTHRGEREAVLAVLEDGSSFRAPGFDDRGELITCDEGDLEKLGELVSGFVTGGGVKPAKGPDPDASHPPSEIPLRKPRGPVGRPPDIHEHPPDEITPSTPAGPPGPPPHKSLSARSSLVRACVATLQTGVLADALASSRRDHQVGET